MKLKSKKLLSLFLVFSLLEISCASITSPTTERRFPEKKRGAIVITKKDGQQIEGELIIVKPNSLLLLDTEGKDVSIDIVDIKVIRIVKKSKSLLGAGIGGAIGFGAGLYVIISSYNASVARGDDGVMIPAILLGSVVVPFAAMVGGAFGGGIGALVGTDKVIYFTRMTDSEIKDALKRLRKKARIRDYK